MLAWGTTVLAVGYVGLLAASAAIVSREASADTAVGRHLVAGALANAALVIVELAIVLGPLRRGELWALWAAAVPTIVYGIPILLLDLTHVARENLVTTLAPQVAGLVVSAIGIALCAAALSRDAG